MAPTRPDDSENDNGNDEADPVRARRAQMGRLADTGQRIGYVCIGVAVVAFVVAAIAGFPGWAVTTTIIGLLGATIVLPPAIVLGYGVRKAEREDPERPAGKRPH